jgi:5-enolpyruvylshikimate-3-phosphate synthase
MPQRFEQLVSLLLTVVGSLTALLAALTQLLKLREELRHKEVDSLARLEKDIVRLDAQVQAHKEEIRVLKQQKIA